MYELYKKVEPNVDKSDLLSRLDRIKYWATTYSPESIAKLLEQKNTEYFDSLPEREQQDIHTLYTTLQSKDLPLDELQQVLYDIPKHDGLDNKQNQPFQKKFFQNVYSLLIGKESGPRLYLFLGALNKDMYLKLLEF